MAGDFSTLKGTLRKEARRRCAERNLALLAPAIAKNISTLLFRVSPPTTLALYAALPNEIPLDATFDEARARGIRCVFPRCLPGMRVLEFREVHALAELVASGNLREPRGDAPLVPLHSIDALLVPGLAFTREGGRLGRGGGAYDATLPALGHARTLGVTSESCLYPTLPLEAHDVLLQAVVTEKGAYSK